MSLLGGGPYFSFNFITDGNESDTKDSIVASKVVFRHKVSLKLFTVT